MITNTVKYCLLFILTTCLVFNAEAQYLCDNEVKVLMKQKKVVKKLAERQVKEWYKKNAVKLKLPEVLKFSKIKLRPQKDFNWQTIDSLFCLNKSKENNIKALKKMSKMKLAVYDIRAYFTFKNATNQAIRSILYFTFDINGDLLVAVIREKENSPYSEKYYH